MSQNRDIIATQDCTLILGTFKWLRVWVSGLGFVEKNFHPLSELKVLRSTNVNRWRTGDDVSVEVECRAQISSGFQGSGFGFLMGVGFRHGVSGPRLYPDPQWDRKLDPLEPLEK